MKKEIRYIAEPEHVREVSLRGSASYAFWARYLKQEEGLAVATHGDKAQLVVVAAEMSWMGIRFREVSISLMVTHRKAKDAYLLLQAFNSNRFFAWSERVCFKTPYAYGQCWVSPEPEAGFGFSVSGTQVFHAQKSSEERAPIRAGNDLWEGPVFLPRTRAGERRVFFGRFKGLTTYLPFASTDPFSISRHSKFPVLQALLDSDFHPEEWVLRPDATHGKSKTYRDEIL